jgi:hypothetical protein
MGLRREFEDADAVHVREGELGLIGFVLVGVLRDPPGAFIPGAPIGLHRDGIVLGIGTGEI